MIKESASPRVVIPIYIIVIVGFFIYLISDRNQRVAIQDELTNKCINLCKPYSVNFIKMQRQICICDKTKELHVLGVSGDK